MGEEVYFMSPQMKYLGGTGSMVRVLSEMYCSAVFSISTKLLGHVDYNGYSFWSLSGGVGFK